MAKALDKLLGQINEMAPNRRKDSDGSIADDAHSQSSDHYPKVYPGYGSTPLVTARDFTHDPSHGADMGRIAEDLRLSRDRRIKYVIFNRRIFNDDDWTWRPYDGSNPHDKHMHVSVDTDMDSTAEWQIGDDMATPEEIASAVWSSGAGKQVNYRVEAMFSQRPNSAQPDNAEVNKQAEVLNDIYSKPSVEAVPIDQEALNAAVAAALSDPAVVASIATAVNDDAAARLAG